MSAASQEVPEACIACWSDLVHPGPVVDSSLFPPLPPGYDYTMFVGSIPAARLLRKQYPIKYLEWPDLDAIRQAALSRKAEVADLGIIHDDSARLVGFGRLSYRGSQGEMSDLVVHSMHRGKKLGSALVDARMAIARHYGVDSLYARLETTNPGLNHYLDRGFSKDWDDRLLFGPDPVPIMSVKEDR